MIDNLVYFTDYLELLVTGTTIVFGGCMVIGFIVWAVFFLMAFFKDATSA